MEYEEVEVNSERWFDLTPLLNEEFKDIKGYEGLYQISNYGRIKSLMFKNNKYIIKKNKILKNISKNRNKKDYMVVGLYKKCYFKSFYIHRLVAKSFLKKIKYKNQINHKDGNKQNNRVDNLEWCNESENQKHAIHTGLKKIVQGEECHNVRKIAQYTKNGEIIKIWNYIALASRELNILAPNIVRCCKHQIKSAGGYKWEYMEKEK